MGLGRFQYGVCFVRRFDKNLRLDVRSIGTELPCVKLKTRDIIIYWGEYS